ncbi:hypothetical protein BpHYR1_030771 [Brachionus plicatilis]|uniref:Uncharacterized protein n=1 Tax=Brachionus plicatilis TaxID=10195 RepID=A0A3M7SYF3_BRAPC|nr:hypothetical protein BpHYR1_030771 [Brachionus plicatilis]
MCKSNFCTNQENLEIENKINLFNKLDKLEQKKYILSFCFDKRLLTTKKLVFFSCEIFFTLCVKTSFLVVKILDPSASNDLISSKISKYFSKSYLRCCFNFFKGDSDTLKTFDRHLYFKHIFTKIFQILLNFTVSKFAYYVNLCYSSKKKNKFLEAVN